MAKGGLVFKFDLTPSIAKIRLSNKKMAKFLSDIRPVLQETNKDVVRDMLQGLDASPPKKKSSLRRLKYWPYGRSRKAPLQASGSLRKSLKKTQIRIFWNKNSATFGPVNKDATLPNSTRAKIKRKHVTRKSDHRYWGILTSGAVREDRGFITPRHFVRVSGSTVARFNLRMQRHLRDATTKWVFRG